MSLPLLAQGSWVGTAWLVSTGLLVALFRSGTPFAPHNAVVWAMAFGMLLEGLAFLLGMLDPTVLDFSIRDDLSTKALWMMIQCTHGGFGWAKVGFLLRRKSSDTDSQTIWSNGLLLGVACSMVGASLILSTGNAELMLAQGIFFLLFESFLFTECYAVIMINMTQPRSREAALLLVGVIGGIILHLWQIYFTVINPAANASGEALTLKLFLNEPLIGLVAYGVYVLAQKREFSPPGSEDVIPLLDKPYNKEFRFAFPEYWFGIQFVPILLAYAITFLLLVTVTKPNMQEVAIFRMYETYHPCILLDYLPGTLVAQPLFTVVVLMSMGTFCLTWLRSCCMGVFGPLFFSSFCWSVSCVTGPLFALVFTFSPDLVSVLAHSVPYMMWEATIALFLLSQAYVVYITDDPLVSRNVKKIFVSYALIYAAIDIYGLQFMTSKLLSNLGYGDSVSASQLAGTVNADSLLKDQADALPVIKFHWIPFLAAVSTHLNQWLYAVLSPMKYRPMAYELIVSDVTSDPANLHPSDIPTPDAWTRSLNVFNIRYQARLPILFASGAILAVLIVSTWINGLILGSDVVGAWTLRDHLKSLPGSAFAVVGWVVIIALVGIHAHSVYLHEMLRNPSQHAVNGVRIAYVSLVATSLLAHAGTLPAFDEHTPWFIGSECFQIALVLWVAVNLALAILRARRPDGGAISTRALVIDAVTSVLLVVLLCVSMMNGLSDGDGSLRWSDIGWVIALGLWSLSDPRDVEIHLMRCHIASNEETMKALADYRPYGVPGFLCDVWGHESHPKDHLENSKDLHAA